MGAQNSKPEETRVFLPQTPTEFSANLLNKLETSLESDYTRAQYTEKYIQDRVAEELKQIELDSAKALKDAAAKVPGPLDDGEKELHSKEIQEKLQQLLTKLESRPKQAKLDAQVEKSRDTVVKCLQDNKDKPIKCLQEFEAFKALYRH